MKSYSQSEIFIPGTKPLDLQINNVPSWHVRPSQAVFDINQNVNSDLLDVMMDCRILANSNPKLEAPKTRDVEELRHWIAEKREDIKSASRKQILPFIKALYLGSLFFVEYVSFKMMGGIVRGMSVAQMRYSERLDVILGSIADRYFGSSGEPMSPMMELALLTGTNALIILMSGAVAKMMGVTISDGHVRSFQDVAVRFISGQSGPSEDLMTSLASMADRGMSQFLNETKPQSAEPKKPPPPPPQSKTSGFTA